MAGLIQSEGRRLETLTLDQSSTPCRYNYADDKVFISINAKLISLLRQIYKTTYTHEYCNRKCFGVLKLTEINQQVLSLLSDLPLALMSLYSLYGSPIIYYLVIMYLGLALDQRQTWASSIKSKVLTLNNRLRTLKTQLFNNKI